MEEPNELKGLDENRPASRKEVERLMEELKQSEVDKEFVWSLWKETQQELPNVSEIIEMVVAREHQKYEEKIQNLVQELEEKDKYISSLLLEKETLGSLNDQVMKSKIFFLEQEISRRDAVIQEYSKKVEVMSIYEHSLEERDEEIMFLRRENSSGLEKCASLTEKLMELEAQLNEAKISRSSNEEQIERLRNELTELNRSREKWADRCAQHMADVKILQDTNKQLKREVSRKDGMELLPARPSPQKTPCVPKRNRAANSMQEQAGESYDVMTLLKAKSEELKSLRSMHNRRLERMKVLQASYELTLQQLKTYETKGSPPRQATVSSNHDSVLQHENSEGVWNELTRYKADCKELRKRLIYSEEERDAIKAQFLHSQTLLAKFRSAAKQKDDIEGKLSAIVAVETINKEKNESMNEMQCIIEELKKENKLVKHQSMSHALECKTLREKLELLGASQLQKRSKKKKYTDISTMTELKHTQQIPANISEAPTSMNVKHVSVMTESRADDTVLVDSAVQVSGWIECGSNANIKDGTLDSNGQTAIHKSTLCHTRRRVRSEGDQQLGFPTTRTKLEGNIKADLSFGPTPPSRRIKTHAGSTSVKKVLSSSSKETSVSVSNDGGEKRKNTASHKCLWQQQVKALQQRMKSLNKQVAVLNTAKQLLTHRLDEQSSGRCKAETELQDIAKNHHAAKLMIEGLKKEKVKSVEEIKELQASVTVLEEKAKHRSEAEWKKLESQQKELQDKCTSQNSTIRSLEKTLQMKTSELSDMMERCSKLERDVRQKRMLIEDYRRKKSEVKTVLSCEDAKMKQLKEDIHAMTETIDQDKQKIKVLRQQFSNITDQKRKVEESLRAANEEISKLHAVCERELRLKGQLNQAKLKLESLIESEKCEHQRRVELLQAEISRCKGIVKEFKSFVRNLANSLAKVLKDEQLKNEESLYIHDRETDALAGRVKEIAQTALNLTESEFEEFFNDEPSTENLLSNVIKERHEAFRTLIELRMSSKLKVPFADDLVQMFSGYIITNLCTQDQE